MERRRTRTQVAAVSMNEGLNPGLLLMMLAIGLVVGLAYGFKDIVFQRGIDRDESYLVLASTLYGQDPTPTVANGIRQRLVAIGIANPSVTVLKLADRFANSRDRQRQREGEGLRLLGEALNAPVDTTAVAASPTVQATPPVTAGATAVGGAVPTVSSVPDTPVPSPSATPQPTVSPATVAPASATAIQTPAAAQGPTGTVKSADKQAVVIRKEPSTRSTKVALVPFGTKVQLLQVTNGTASDPGIDPKELRWYKVKWGSYVGYIYYKLITAD